MTDGFRKGLRSRGLVLRPRPPRGNDRTPNGVLLYAIPRGTRAMRAAYDRSTGCSALPGRRSRGVPPPGGTLSGPALSHGHADDRKPGAGRGVGPGSPALGVAGHPRLPTWVPGQTLADAPSRPARACLRAAGGRRRASRRPNPARRTPSARRCVWPWPASSRTSGSFWCCTSSLISPSPQLAKALDAREDTVNTRLGRALGHLRERLEAQGAQEVANDGS